MKRDLFTELMLGIEELKQARIAACPRDELDCNPSRDGALPSVASNGELHEAWEGIVTP